MGALPFLLPLVGVAVADIVAVGLTTKVGIGLMVGGGSVAAAGSIGLGCTFFGKKAKETVTVVEVDNDSHDSLQITSQ